MFVQAGYPTSNFVVKKPHSQPDYVPPRKKRPPPAWSNALFRGGKGRRGATEVSTAPYDFGKPSKRVPLKKPLGAPEWQYDDDKGKWVDISADREFTRTGPFLFPDFNQRKTPGGRYPYDPRKRLVAKGAADPRFDDPIGYGAFAEDRKRLREEAADKERAAGAEAAAAGVADPLLREEVARVLRGPPGSSVDPKERALRERARLGVEGHDRRQRYERSRRKQQAEELERWQKQLRDWPLGDSSHKLGKMYGPPHSMDHVRLQLRRDSGDVLVYELPPTWIFDDQNRVWILEIPDNPHPIFRRPTQDRLVNQKELRFNGGRLPLLIHRQVMHNWRQEEDLLRRRPLLTI
ncbi:unnamed protein product [Amoebophrya sp. A120]|nr:unnamed protein product [Amoebophrya sp. A120]|eukprot:GSA120T00021716001.1